MLKMIHAAKPTIQAKELLKHEKRSNQLKKMVSEGTKRQSIIQAARQLIISQEVPRRLHQHSQKWNRNFEKK
jgi:hypothetical protein